MKFRQANKILRKYAILAVESKNGIFRTHNCNYEKAVTVYMRHFRKGKKKVATRTIMPFTFPVI